jgi:hypothetical protein
VSSRQEDLEFNASLGPIVRPYLKKKIKEYFTSGNNLVLLAT